MNFKSCIENKDINIERSRKGPVDQARFLPSVLKVLLSVCASTTPTLHNFIQHRPLAVLIFKFSWKSIRTFYILYFSININRYTHIFKYIKYKNQSRNLLINKFIFKLMTSIVIFLSIILLSGNKKNGFIFLKCRKKIIQILKSIIFFKKYVFRKIFFSKKS